jgi:HSP20 family protein
MSLLHHRSRDAEPAEPAVATDVGSDAGTSAPAEVAAPEVIPADPPEGVPAPWSSWRSDRWPRIEESRDGDCIVVRFEMPGLDPDEDVEVHVTDGMLHITAERREETTGDADTGYRSELRFGSYARALPPGANEGDVKATYGDGVLEVRVPVDEARAAAKRIPVSRL